MINIISEPPFIAPSGNPMIFRVEDDNPELAFFRVTLKDTETNEILGVSRLFKTPTSEGNFIDVSRRLRDFNFTEVDNTSMVYSPIKGAIRYEVEFEAINSNGTVLDSVTSTPKWSFNGGRDVLNGYNYDVVNYYMNINQIGTNYADFLTAKPYISNIYLFQKEMLYFLADGDSGIEEVKIELYRKDGTVIQTITENVTIDDTILHRLYIQPNMLSDIYDFDVTELYRMEVALFGAGNTRISVKRTYVVDSRYDCSVDKVNILWENYEGGIDTYTYINPKEIKSSNRQTMLLNGYTEPINNVYSNLSQVVNSFVESTYSLTSLGITDEMYDTLTNIIGTENAYVELGDGNLWGIIIENDSLEVKRRKYETSLLRLNLRFKSVPSLDIINRGSVLITERDTPNPLNFTNLVDTEFDTMYTSNTAVISGINVPVTVSITNGQYRINNGIWTSSPTQVRNGDTITLRLTTGAEGLQDYSTSVTVGGGTFEWKVTTKERLEVPDTISFTSLMNTELNTTQTSNLVTITGINVPISISVSSGSYSKNGGAYSTTPTTAVNGDTFRVRHTSAGVGLTNTTTVFIYGGKTANFITSTREYNIVPDQFSFVDLVDVPLGSQQESNIITITGITDPITASITNGQYRVNGGSWRSTNSTVVDGDTIQLRLTASGIAGTSVSTTFTAGTVSASWKVDNAQPVISPEPFSFTDQTGVALNTYILSNIITVTGINVGSPISLNPTTRSQYRVNGGSWTTADGIVFNGDTVQLRTLSSTLYETDLTTTLTVGGVSGSWTVKTMEEPFVGMTVCSERFLSAQYRLHFTLTESVSQNINVIGNLNYPKMDSTIGVEPFNVTLTPAGGLEQTFSVTVSTPSSTTGTSLVNITSTSPAPNSTINTPTGMKKFKPTMSGRECN